MLKLRRSIYCTLLILALIIPSFSLATGTVPRASDTQVIVNPASETDLANVFMRAFKPVSGRALKSVVFDDIIGKNVYFGSVPILDEAIKQNTFFTLNDYIKPGDTISVGDLVRVVTWLGPDIGETKATIKWRGYDGYEYSNQGTLVLYVTAHPNPPVPKGEVKIKKGTSTIIDLTDPQAPEVINAPPSIIAGTWKIRITERPLNCKVNVFGVGAGMTIKPNAGFTGKIILKITASGIARTSAVGQIIVNVIP